MASFASVLLAVAMASAAPGQSLDPIYLGSDSPTTAAPAKRADAASDTAKATEPAVEIDKEAMRIAVKGRFTGTAGAIELGACAKGGRTFLAAVVLDARPGQIADAMTALGIEPGQVPVADRKNATATLPTGREVNLFVQWHTTVKTELLLRRVRLEEFFWNRATDKVLPDSPWVYAGSTFVRDKTTGTGLFVADLSGSVATTSRLDTSALFYYGGTLPERQVWQANPAARPAPGTACRLIIEPVPVKKPDVEKPPVPTGDTPESTPTETQPETPAPESTPTETQPETPAPESTPVPEDAPDRAEPKPAPETPDADADPSEKPPLAEPADPGR